MLICLPGMASKVKRAATSADSFGALGDHDELDHHQDQKDDEADDVVAPDHEVAESEDELPGVTLQEDETGAARR